MVHPPRLPPILSPSPSPLHLLSPRTHRLLGSIAIYAGYIVVSMIFLFPLLWVASLSLRPMAELFAFPPHLIPQHPTLAAYRDVLIGSPLALYLLNSVKLVSLCDRAVRSRDRHPERLRTVAPALPPTGAEIAGHARHARGATDLAAGHCIAAVSLVLALGLINSDLALIWSMSRSALRSPPGC